MDGGRAAECNVDVAHRQNQTRVGGAGWVSALPLHPSLKELTLPSLLSSPGRGRAQEFREEAAFVTVPFPGFLGNCAASRRSRNEAVGCGGVRNTNAVLVPFGITSTPRFPCSAASKPQKVPHTHVHTHTSDCSFLIWCQVPKQRPSRKCYRISLILPM